MPGRTNYGGWRTNPATRATYINKEGVDVAEILDDAIAIAVNTTVTGDLTVSGTITGGAVVNEGEIDTLRFVGAGFFGLGTPEQSTIASGVLTVTRPYANMLPESSTTDTVDSITYTSSAEGDLLMLMSTATNTITLDNSATLLLGAGTRAVAPGGSILLQKVGTTWVERTFLTAAS